MPNKFTMTQMEIEPLMTLYTTTSSVLNYHPQSWDLKTQFYTEKKWQSINIFQLPLSNCSNVKHIAWWTNIFIKFKIKQCISKSKQDECIRKCYKMRLERWILWSILKFQRWSLHNITGNDVSRANKGKTNVIMASKATLVSKVTCNDAIQGLLQQCDPRSLLQKLWYKVCCNVVQGHCCNNEMKDVTDRQGKAYKVFFFTYVNAQRAPKNASQNTTKELMVHIQRNL
jgi:hypothetical protein